jgi:hypothetical protein
MVASVACSDLLELDPEARIEVVIDVLHGMRTFGSSQFTRRQASAGDGCPGEV